MEASNNTQTDAVRSTAQKLFIAVAIVIVLLGIPLVLADKVLGFGYYGTLSFMVLVGGKEIIALYRALASVGDTQATFSYLAGICLALLAGAGLTMSQSAVFIKGIGSFVFWYWFITLIVILVILPRIVKRYDIQNLGDQFVILISKLFYKGKCPNFYHSKHVAPIARQLARDLVNPKIGGNHSEFRAWVMFGGAFFIVSGLVLRETINGAGQSLFMVNAVMTAMESLINPAATLTHHNDFYSNILMAFFFVAVALFTGGGGSKIFGWTLATIGLLCYLLEGVIGIKGIMFAPELLWDFINPIYAYEWATQNPLHATAIGGVSTLTIIPMVKAMMATSGLTPSGIEGLYENITANGGKSVSIRLAIVNAVVSITCTWGILIASLATNTPETKQAEFVYIPILAYPWLKEIAMYMILLIAINASSTLVISNQQFWCHTIGKFLEEKTKNTPIEWLFRIRGTHQNPYTIVVALLMSVILVGLTAVMKSHDEINDMYGIVIFITLSLIDVVCIMTLLISVVNFFVLREELSWKNTLIGLLSMIFLFASLYLQMHFFPTEKALGATKLWILLVLVGTGTWYVKRWKHHEELNDQLDNDSH